MENKLSSNFERKLWNSSVDWEGDLCYNIDGFTDWFPIISNIEPSLNHELLRIFRYSN